MWLGVKVGGGELERRARPREGCSRGSRTGDQAMGDDAYTRYAASGDRGTFLFLSPSSMTSCIFLFQSTRYRHELALFRIGVTFALGVHRLYCFGWKNLAIME